MKTIRESDGRERVRLETWGEVASHLGIEVRTAQRWEARLGLPVRRMDGSQAVFAFADELDHWRADREFRKTDKAPAAPTLPPEPVEPPKAPVSAQPPAHLPLPVFVPVPVPAPLTVTAIPEAPLSFRAWAGIFGVLIVVAIVLARPFLVTPNHAPSVLAIEGSRLLALNAEGTSIWSHDFSESIAIIDTGSRPELRKWWQLADIEGDGRSEVVVVLSHVGPDGTPFDVLHVFESDGSLRYSYSPAITLRFKAGTYTGPWAFWDIEPQPHEKTLWLAFEHSPWWPSAVVSLDPSGKETLRYVQPGSIKILRSMQFEGRPHVLAAGVNNEFASASLALLDPAAPPAAAPQDGDGEFACIECPAGLPVRYVLLPASPLNRLDGLPYNRVDDLSVGADIQVETYESLGGAAMVYQLSRNFDVKSVTPSDTYWTKRPRSGAPWPPQDGEPLEMYVRSWQENRWSVARVPYSPPPPARLTDGCQ
ncbi:MAG: hypothetical protein WC815_18205 [Vicinamibacterales bacterium]|jgi:hypothetical protein